MDRFARVPHYYLISFETSQRSYITWNFMNSNNKKRTICALLHTYWDCSRTKECILNQNQFLFAEIHCSIAGIFADSPDRLARRSRTWKLGLFRSCVIDVCRCRDIQESALAIWPTWWSVMDSAMFAFKYIQKLALYILHFFLYRDMVTVETWPQWIVK